MFARSSSSSVIECPAEADIVWGCGRESEDCFGQEGICDRCVRRGGAASTRCWPSRKGRVDASTFFIGS